MKPTIIEGRVVGNIYDLERDKKLKQELEHQGKGEKNANE
jgi:hypothetical protein